MSVCCWLFLFKLFASTDSSHNIILSKPQVKDRKVNLELETVLEFNNKDNAADIHFLNNIQNFIGKVKKVIDKNNHLRRDFSSGKLEKFTDFIHNIIDIIYKFEDDDLEYFFAVVSDEIRKYHYRGCKFHELAENYGLRKFVTNGLDALKNIPARSIRKKILAVAEKIEEEKYENNEKELVSFINSLYRQNSVEKFRKILINFDDYRLNARNGNVSLVKIIREGIRSIIFDHYTELNHNAREALKSKMEEYFKYLMDLSNTLVSQLNAEEIRLRSHNGDNNIETIKDFKRHQLNAEEIRLRSHDGDNNIETIKDLKRHKQKAYKIKTSNHNKHALDVTGRKKNNIYIDLNNYMQVKYETPYYEFTTEGKTEFKKMTFMTLYPKFVGLPKKFRSAVKSPDSSSIKNKIKLKKERDRKSQVDTNLRAYEPVSEADFNNRNRKQPTTKEHKEKRTMRQIYVERNIDVKSNPYTRDKSTTIKQQPSKMTFMTLYPEFDKGTVTKTPLMAKKLFSSTPIENTMQTLWYEKMQKLHHNILQEDPKAMLSTDKRVLEVVTMKPFGTRKVLTTKKLKYEVNLRSHDIQRNNLELAMKKPEFAVATLRTKYSDSELKNKLLQPIAGVKQASIDLSNGNIKFGKEVPTSSVKRFVDQLIDRKHRRSYGDGLSNIPKDTVLVNKRILTRLQELEKELKIVQSRILNDTETIMDLNRKVHRKAIYNRNDHKGTHEYNTNKPSLKRETKSIDEVVFDLAAQIKLNDGRLSSKLANTKKVSSDLVEWKNYLKKLENTELTRNKKYTNDEIRHSTLNRDKNDNVKDNLFYIDKEVNREIKQTPDSNTNVEKLEQNDKISMINKKYMFGDKKYKNQHKTDHGNNKNTNQKVFKQRFDLKSFTGEKMNTYSKKKSEKAYDFDRKSVNTDLYLNKFHGKTNNEDFSNIKKIQAKERAYVKSTTYRLDDNNNNYQIKHGIIKNMNEKDMNQRFSLKSYSDNKVSSHSNKANEKIYNIEGTYFDRDKYRNYNQEIVNQFASHVNNKIKQRELEYDRNIINRPGGNNVNQYKHNLNTDTNANQKYNKHRFQLSNYREDKNNFYPNEIDKTKYDFNETTLKDNIHHKKYMENNNENKSHQIGLRFIDVNEYRKQQESKYYSSSMKNDLDGSNTNRQRIYESDSNKDEYKVNTNNHLEGDAQTQIDRRINKLNEERGMEKNRTTYDYHVTDINNTNLPTYYETTRDYKMHTIDTIYESRDRKSIKANEFGSDVTMNTIQKDLRSNVDRSRSEVKNTDQDIHIDNISRWTENYESARTDNISLQMNENEKEKIYSGSYTNNSVSDFKSKMSSEKNKFIIIDEYTGDQTKDISNLHDPQPKPDRYYDPDNIRNNLVKVNDLKNYGSHEVSKEVKEFKKENKIEFDFKADNQTESIITKENSTQGKYDFGRDKLPLRTSQKKNDVVFKSDTKKNVEHKFSSTPTDKEVTVSLHESHRKLVRDFKNKYDVDRVQGNVDKIDDIDKKRFYEGTNREKYNLDKDRNKNVLTLKEINSTNGKLKYDNGKIIRSDVSHEKSDVVFKSDIKKDVLNKNIENKYYTKQTMITVSLQRPNTKLDGEHENKYDTGKVSRDPLRTNGIDKNSFHGGNAKMYDSIKDNKIKIDLNISDFKTETLSKEKDGILKHAYNGNIITDVNRNKKGFLFKSNSDKDALDKYMELNYYNQNNDTDVILKERTTHNVQINNYLGGGVLNEHSQTTQHVRHISYDKFNQSYHSELPVDIDKPAHEDKYIKKSEKSTTIKLNSTKQTNYSDTQRETTPVNNAIVKKDSFNHTQHLKEKQNQNKTNSNNIWFNRTSTSTISTIKPTTIVMKTTTVSVTPSAIRRIFTDVTQRSIAFVTADASLPVLSSHIPGPRMDDYSIPTLNYGGVDPYDATNLGYGGYNDMRRFNPAAPDLYQQYADTNINSTLSVDDASGNQTLDLYGQFIKKAQLNRDLYDYDLRNASQKENLPFVPSPGFIRPPAFDDPVLL